MKKMIAVLALLPLAAAGRAAVVEAVAYPGAGAAAAAWKPQDGAKAVTLSMGGDLKRAIQFPCDFSGLKDWRLSWDRDLKADLSSDEQILLTIRSPQPGDISQGILYFRSGSGWYRLPPFSVGSAWETKVLVKSQAVAEDQPAGWQSIDGLRLSLLPGAKTDTVFELARLEGRAGWPLDYAGALGGHKNLSEAAAAFTAQAQAKPQEKDVALRLAAAKLLEGEAAAERDPAQRQEKILSARAQAAQAYALLQQPQDPEFRAVWIHHGDGVRGQGGQRVRRWKEALPELKAQGFNTVIPNVLWSGIAFYPSKVVPSADEDYLREILDAAKPLGMKVHAWKVMWQFSEGWMAPAGVSKPFREQGRLQLDATGKELPWLCPCDQRNRRYELDAILELARHYDVDGIHLDYIRWDGDGGSFTPACRERFEKWSKQKVERWPQDVVAGGARQAQWKDFKREVISSFVKETRAALKALKPKLQLSAAVFPDPGLARDAVYQDWPRWVKEGWVDWISTMTYNEDPAGFKAAVQKQQLLMNPKVKLYPGIQVTFDGGRSLALESAVDEIKAVRELGLKGFTFFEWRDHLQDSIAPYLRAGLLRQGPYGLKIRELPDYAKAALPQAGQALDAAPAKDGSVLVDDFEDGNLSNAFYAPWVLDADNNGNGTKAGPRPLDLVKGGAKGSKAALGMAGHIAKNAAPWPYASLFTYFNPDQAPADLTKFSALSFWARGDGQNYEAVLKQKVVADYGNYRAVFKAGKDWTLVTLPFKEFKQPGWAQPVPRQFSDVIQLQFSPSGLSDQDFDLVIDQVRLLP
jgi:uncharacterized lipoprotein YddW (UPF0748 family)